MTRLGSYATKRKKKHFTKIEGICQKRYESQTKIGKSIKKKVINWKIPFIKLLCVVGFDLVLWHINHCRLFNAKFQL